MRSMDYMDNREVVRMLAKELRSPLVTMFSSEHVADVKMLACKYNYPVYVKLEKLYVVLMLAAGGKILSRSSSSYRNTPRA